jgi:hypothetical protein
MGGVYLNYRVGGCGRSEREGGMGRDGEMRERHVMLCYC